MISSDLQSPHLWFSAPSSIKCAFCFYLIPGGSLKCKREEKAMDGGWPGGWAMMNDGRAVSFLYLAIFITRKYSIPSIPCKSHKSPNCHIKTLVIKTHPPTNVNLTFGMAVWVWMSPLIEENSEIKLGANESLTLVGSSHLKMVS